MDDNGKRSDMLVFMCMCADDKTGAPCQRLAAASNHQLNMYTAGVLDISCFPRKAFTNPTAPKRC